MLGPKTIARLNQMLGRVLLSSGTVSDSSMVGHKFSTQPGQLVALDLGKVVPLSSLHLGEIGTG